MSKRVNYIHPFPARMAPELALRKTEQLADNSLVLDPMIGSGTVLQAAIRHGHRCIGFDVDPLAVLMTKVSTERFSEDIVRSLCANLFDRAAGLAMSEVDLPWFDQETEDFTNYWFAAKQRRDLKRLAFGLHNGRLLKEHPAEANILSIALSRLIITKDAGASLARDVSHSRPHRVADDNDFDVFAKFGASVDRVICRLSEIQFRRRPTVRLGDARRLNWVRDSTVDMVMTSPPYLNAIDYMRGHRLSLVWLGHSLSSLRNIRSNSIGAERALDSKVVEDGSRKIRASLGRVDRLSARHSKMVDRYSADLLMMTRQVSRVLKIGGQAVFVVGNSCLTDVFISNSRGVETAASMAGLKLVSSTERKLPNHSRYLPMPSDKTSALGRRMRTENVLGFVKRS